MVRYDNILKVIIDYAEKCHDYPKANAMKNFNPENFQDETWNTNSHIIPSPQGYLQRTQEELQKSVNYTNMEVGALNDYKTNSFIPLNYWLNGGELPTTPNELRRDTWTIGISPVSGIRDEETGELLWRHEGDGDKKGVFVTPIHNMTNWETQDDHQYVSISMQQEDELLSRAISKTPSLQQDTVLYTYRELPADLKIGDHGIISGYGSTSFNKHVCEDIRDNGAWVQGEKDKRLMCKVYAPKGTQGIVLNEQNSGSIAWQSEWLLNKKQRYFVHNIDYETMTAEIVLY